MRIDNGQVVADTQPLKAWCAPALRWAGSKRSLLPQLAQRAKLAKGRYVEPFAGSACLFFALGPRPAVLGDLNQELIETYRCLREHPRLVSRAMHGWSTDVDTYYQVRSARQSELGSIERAARFLYLNRLCFNGVFRTNRHGQFNVPYGAKTGALPSEAHLYRCSFALRSADLRYGDFDATIADVSPGDFVYLDPPYTQGAKTSYGVYGYGSFNSSELDRALQALRRIDEAGASFLFSYANVDGLEAKLDDSWVITHLSVTGRVAANVGSRVPRQEVLVSNQTDTVNHGR
jgi:DNA adenine methylase